MSSTEGSWEPLGATPPCICPGFANGPIPNGVMGSDNRAHFPGCPVVGGKYLESLDDPQFDGIKTSFSNHIFARLREQGLYVVKEGQGVLDGEVCDLNKVQAVIRYDPMTGAPVPHLQFTDDQSTIAARMLDIWCTTEPEE